MLDGIIKNQKKPLAVDYALAKFVQKHKNNSVLFSRKYGQVRDFMTRDSKLYLTQNELARLRRGEKINFATDRLDSAVSRREKAVRYAYRTRPEAQIYSEINERYSSFKTYLKDLLSGYTHGVSMARAWNLSLVGSLIFGMFLMTMIYRYLGPGARADIEESKIQEAIVQLNQKQEEARVLGEKIAKAEAKANEQSQADATKKQIEDAKLAKQKEFETKIRGLVGNHPIKQMAPYIAKEDPLVAAFFIAIARKESSWGDHVPVHNGQDCYNYVGFRLKTETLGSGDHSCFSSPKEGFERTAKRIKDLIYNEKMTTAQKMVSPWKCGYRPNLDDPVAVRKWVSDVDSILKEVQSWKIVGNR